MIKIAFIGYGTVGKGAYKILKEKINEIKFAFGEEIEVSKILRRNVDGKTEDGKEIFTSDFDEILNDKDIKLVVEMTGAMDKAYEYITKSLKAKKHVVTANKAVVSEYFKELNSLAIENKVSFLYEAAVGGSIPIITPLITQTTINDICCIRGILNGTSNYLLSRMYDEKISYQDVLKDAQSLGYAESDPYNDVEGVDTLRKLAILSTIGFKGVIKNEDILRHGISNINEEDIKFLKDKKLKPKLLAQSIKNKNEITSIVEPVLLSSKDKLYNVEGADNSVEIYGQNYSSLVFTGEGAGSLPTGNAIVSDIIDALRGCILKINISEELKINNEFEGIYYLRVLNDVDINIKATEIEYFGKYKIIKTEKISRNKILKTLEGLSDYFIARYED